MPKKPTDGWLFYGVHFPPALIQLAKENRISKHTVRNRVRYQNMTAYEAVTTSDKRKELKDHPSNPDVKKYKVLAMKQGIPLDTYLNRVYGKNIPPKRAVEMGR